MEQKVGSLGRLIRSASRLNAILVANVTRHGKADLMSSFGEKHLPQKWANATAKKQKTTGLPVGRLIVPDVVGPDCAFIPPNCVPAAFCAAELANERAALVTEIATAVAGDILAKTSFRAKLACSKFAGSKPVGSDCDKHRRRNYLVRHRELLHPERDRGAAFGFDFWSRSALRLRLR